MAFFRTKHTRDILMWMLSTKMMPAVGALVPIYVMAQTAGLLDSLTGTDHRLHAVQPADHGLDAVLQLQGHPARHPRSRAHGRRHIWGEFLHVILPLAMGTLASTGLLCLVLSWNEAFWSLNLSSAKAGTLATLIASYSSPEGLFWAKLSAASLMAIAPIVVFGWFSQKQLVQGLTFGAVK
jgi:sorbitol/mannitol transport system permease protein